MRPALSLGARWRPVRLRFQRRAEVHAAGVPGRPRAGETGTSHRRKHLAALLAAQPIRGGADLRAASPVDGYAAREPLAVMAGPFTRAGSVARGTAASPARGRRESRQRER